MTVFKITRKKVTFGGAAQPQKNIRKILRKNEEERSARSPTSSFSFGLIKDSPSRDR
jgi:hypothetical protein